MDIRKLIESDDSLKPMRCPICGEDPEVEDDLANFYIECCVHMSLQKSDIMTMEERRTIDYDTYRYPDELEKKAFKYLVDRWNTRYEGV